MITPLRIHGTADAYCFPHGRVVKAGASCPLCPGRGATVAPVAKQAPRPRSGADTEAMLAAQLAAAGYFDTTHRERPDGIDPRACFRREQPWGLRLAPERGFRGDVVFLDAGLKVEIVGMSHAAKRSNVAGDVEREGLAATTGLRSLPLSPESVRDGSAVERINAALAAGGG